MKKIIVIAAVVISLGLTGLPVINGMIMEKRVKQSLEEINRRRDTSRPGALFELIRYDRHFFSSEIEWKIVSGALENICGTHEIIFFDRVKHGLTKVSTATSLEKNPWFNDRVNRKLKGKNPLTIITEFNLSGKMKSMLALDTVSYADGTDTVTIQACKAILSMDPRNGSIALNIDIPGLDVAGQKTVISNMGFDYEFLSHPKEDAVSIKMKGRLGLFQTGGHEIKNSLARIHINHMDAGGYRDLKGIFQKGAADILSEGPSAWHNAKAIRLTMERRVAEKGFEWFGTCEKLLKKNLEIEVMEFKTQLPEGDIEAHGKIKLEKDVPVAELISIIMAPSKALDYISLKSRIILPRTPGIDDGLLLSPLFPGMPTGLFVPENGLLIHMAETRDGKLFLNEKEMLMN